MPGSRPAGVNGAASASVPVGAGVNGTAGVIGGTAIEIGASDVSLSKKS